MRRFIAFLCLTLCLAVQFSAFAQGNPQSQPGKPPTAALISVSNPDANGVVEIVGAAGAVFPSAQVAVRNLYTAETVYVNAGFSGNFNVRLFGPGTTPFWVSAAVSFPADVRRASGSMPGGPGTIIYGTTPESGPVEGMITRLVIDGTLDDWSAYDTAGLRSGVFSLITRDSIFFGLRLNELRDPFAVVRFTILVDGATYTINVDPQQLRIASAQQTTPTFRNRGEFAANIALDGDRLELRVPADIIDSDIGSAQLVGLTLLNEGQTELANFSYDNLEIPLLNLVDGVYYPDGRLTDESETFFVAGPTQSAFWTAVGRVNQMDLSPGDRIVMELDVTYNAPNLPLTANDLTFSGVLGLQPTFAAAQNTNNGWSNVRTPSGLAVDNLSSDLILATAEVDWSQVIRLPDRLIFGLRFEAELPADLPSGIYVPTFSGRVSEASGEIALWGASPVFGSLSVNPPPSVFRLPVTLNVGAIEETRLPMALFFDHPSDGSRGVLSTEDSETLALSNRVRFNSPTYILPPGSYPVEPYILNQMPNSFTETLPPLIPLLFPGGRLDVTITQPDGSRQDLGSLPIVQNRLSTETLDERNIFGAQSPLDVYRLTTLNSGFTEHEFSQYGEYIIEVGATMEDRFGNRYAGGGTYTLMIADPLDLTPGVLPGTPFEVGDRFYPGLRVAPGLPVDVQVDVQVFPLDGGEVIETRINGQANRYGVFAPDADTALTFETPGEYIADYLVQYSDAEGRIWAASLRGAGVIGNPDTSLITHGRRGLVNYVPAEDEPRPAWYNLSSYPPDNGDIPELLYTPYHRGDVAVYTDSSNSGIGTLMQVQDAAGNYADWLRAAVPDYVSLSGDDMASALREAALPLLMVPGGAPETSSAALKPDMIVNNAYGYVSAVRPGVSVRQFVHGSDQGALPLYWDADDPVNRQIGAGVNGSRPGDYTFLFGGSIVKNAEAGVQDAAIYAALGVNGLNDGGVFGARVYPPYRAQAGGPDAGSLLTFREIPYEVFFHPTGIVPGQVMTRDDNLVFAGQVAPTLQSRVEVLVTAPSGATTTFAGLSNAIGYFYDPANNLPLDEIGLWNVQVRVTPVADTSIGALAPPLPHGGILGTVDGSFTVYVTDPDAEPLRWNRGGNIEDTTPAGGLINFTVNIPQGWTDHQSYRTVTIPGYVLDGGVLRSTNPASYQYSPPALSQEFPNLEAEGRGDGAWASDVVTLTFAISGEDADGTPQLRTRTFTIMHGQILSFEEE